MGRRFIDSTGVVRGKHLRSGAIKSCGCLRKEQLDRFKYNKFGSDNCMWNPNREEIKRNVPCIMVY